ncbi:ADP-ribosylation factor-like protein 13A [Brachionichthys hirsutus]|uniref:ADP-ribosylation factor-like protein 13A n=1 Tax=Brachionichthys hirsutus TaxID=412623 RepID=UPI003605234C
MFNLMSNCCTWINKIQEPVRKVAILVVGLDKAGKTSSIRGMLRVSHGAEAGPTQGCVRNEMRVENFSVTLLDVGGSAESRGAWRAFYGEAHGLVFVVDSSDKHRIKEVKEVLAELLRNPRVSGKPLLVLANKQDKMNAFLGSELIELLSLEKLVNQSRSLCHIEPCSALMDLRRWSDRKTLRGLRWLLRAVCLDYPELCARVAQDKNRPLEPREKTHRKTKGERMRTSKSDLHQVHRPKNKEKKSKGEGKLQPIRNMLQKETTQKQKLKTKKRKKLKAKESEKEPPDTNDQEEEEEEEVEGNDEEQENSGQREKAGSALISPKTSKPKRKTRVKEEIQTVPESPDNNKKAHKVKGEKKKKKIVAVKRKNKINTEAAPGAYSQPADLSATFDLYRKAILALKERQDQGK